MRINKALYVAALLFEAELRGYSDVFMPIYDCRLAGTKELIMQLCHETYGKQGKGHTVLALDAPESQHHTNQRYFGGPQNMVGAFISAQHGDLPSTIFIPEQAWGVPINGKILGLLHGVPHLTALHAELTGVLTHAKERDMPYVHLVVDRVDAHHVGYFTAFWQLVAVYGAVLRGVNPFDQPEVEHAKQVTRQLLL